MKKQELETLKAVVAELDREGDTAWELHIYERDSYDVETWSNEGENIIISLSGQTLAELAADAKEAAEAFDAEEHAAHILVAKRDGNEDEQRFYAGAPDSLYALLRDAEQIQGIYNALAELLARRAK